MSIKTERMAKVSKRQSWITKDHSTPMERRWLDRLEKVRPDMAPVWVTNGDSIRDGFSSLTTILRRKRQGCDFGCYIVDLAWVKREVLRLEREILSEKKREAANFVGSGI